MVAYQWSGCACCCASLDCERPWQVPPLPTLKRYVCIVPTLPPDHRTFVLWNGCAQYIRTYVLRQEAPATSFTPSDALSLVGIHCPAASTSHPVLCPCTAFRASGMSCSDQSAVLYLPPGL